MFKNGQRRAREKRNTEMVEKSDKTVEYSRWNCHSNENASPRETVQGNSQDVAMPRCAHNWNCLRESIERKA
ncbi:MAG: hypothetical protein V4463_19550 [Pseudomonadota bacterium]